MLRDRMCPEGGWNAGNSIVFGSGLRPHIDATAIGLLALPETDPAASSSRNWLRQASMRCPSGYSLAWSAIAFLIHHDEAANHCIAQLLTNVSPSAPFITETLSLAAIALKSATGYTNPFQVAV